MGNNQHLEAKTIFNVDGDKWVGNKQHPEANTMFNGDADKWETSNTGEQTQRIM